jgi:hypothetical protein
MAAARNDQHEPRRKAAHINILREHTMDDKQLSSFFYHVYYE